eukprot:gb/GECH01006110.1/.p1 GENE.gb/GECH01006110.1/~~gb/GECH01006110.1/.p1  ORF type:complete len:268 (+),score=39.87 gb/GECH01006110.1/:1-804(+)
MFSRHVINFVQHIIAYQTRHRFSSPSVADMVQDMMQKSAQEVSNAFRVMDSETSHQPLWAGALQIILECYRNLSTIMPAPLLNPLLENVYQPQKKFVKKTCERAVHEVSMLCTNSPQISSTYIDNMSPTTGDGEEKDYNDEEDASLSSATNLPDPSMPKAAKFPTEDGTRRHGDNINHRRGVISRARVSKTNRDTKHISPVHATNISRLFGKHMLEIVKLVCPIIAPLFFPWKAAPRAHYISPMFNMDRRELSYLENQTRTFINDAF